MRVSFFFLAGARAGSPNRLLWWRWDVQVHQEGHGPPLPATPRGQTAVQPPQGVSGPPARALAGPHGVRPATVGWEPVVLAQSMVRLWQGSAHQQWYRRLAPCPESSGRWQMQPSPLHAHWAPAQRGLLDGGTDPVGGGMEVGQDPTKKYREIQGRLFEQWQQYERREKNGYELLKPCSRLNGPARSA